MALSDYDSFALNEKSKPINGVFTTPIGVSVKIYKTWVYIRDPEGWQDKGHFVKPTVMQLNHGALIYKDLEIVATRGPKLGIYVAAWHTEYGKDSKFTTTGMVGIGCSGYLSQIDLVLEKLGRKQKDGDMWGRCTTTERGKTRYTIENIKTGEKIEHEGFDLDSLWVGVAPAEVEFLKQFVEKDYGIPDELKKIRFEIGDKI